MKLLLLLVLLAPLPFGCVLPWSWSLMAVCIGALIALYARVIITQQQLPVPFSKLFLVMVPFLLAAAWAYVQSSSRVPDTWQNEIWRASASALGVPVRGSVSVSPYDTVGALTKLLSYGGAFWLAVQYGRSRRNASLAVRALALAGGVYALYGLLVFASGSETVLWFPKTAYLGDLTSTFVNRNTYATYAGLGLLCTTVVISRQLAPALSAASWRERLLLSLDLLAGRTIVWPIIWAALFSALLLTHSRGGFVSTMLALAVMLAAILVASPLKFRALLFRILPFLLAGVGLFFVGGEITARRLGETDWLKEERHQVYELTMQAIQQSPVLGTGYGTFPDVFQHYRLESMNLPYDFAHNVYLENTLELGRPAALLLFFSVAMALLRCFIGVRVRSRDIGFPLLGIGSTVLVGAHGIVDFSIEIPAVAWTYAFIMGTSVAQSWKKGPL